jgi:hypothetical protein
VPLELVQRLELSSTKQARHRSGVRKLEFGFLREGLARSGDGRRDCRLNGTRWLLASSLNIKDMKHENQELTPTVAEACHRSWDYNGRDRIIFKFFLDLIPLGDIIRDL